MSNELIALQNWYARHCDGEWEHQRGIRIGSLDNPGWRVTINVAATELAGRPFPTTEEHYDHESDWLRCWLEGETFHAAGGPLKLSRMLRIFLDWAAEPAACSDSTA